MNYVMLCNCPMFYACKHNIVPRGPTRASEAYEISRFPSDFLISALVISDFRCSPQKYTDVRGDLRKYTDVRGG